jgi:hypothetical protein
VSPETPTRSAWPGALVRQPAAQLFLTSFLALYLELLCIRWMPAHVRFLSYFTNFILLASFLGLGVGILSARRATIALDPRAFPALLLGIAVMVAVTKFEVRLGSPGVLYYGAGEGGAFPRENYLVLPAGFVLVTLLFACIGRAIGSLIPAVSPPLRAYAWDIAGSLFGIAAFFVLSLTRQPPVVWFAGLSVLGVLLAGTRWLDRAVVLSPLIATTVIAGVIGAPFYWSPYYKIGLTSTLEGRGYELNVNDTGHQVMAPPELKEPFYREPYDLFGQRAFGRALIIGAGSGSDTAVALAAGVAHVDAVEIDPVIAELGRQFHPSHPFSDPRVTVHIGDGRAFLRASRETFDLIIFALPDSLTLTSQFASLRLESFLFTEEAFRDARARLSPDGVIVLYNYYRQVWLLRKLAGMLETAFGSAPYVVSYGGGGRAGVLVDGPRLASLLARSPEMARPYTERDPANGELAGDPDGFLLPVAGSGLLARSNAAGDPNLAVPALPTDDWPLLYLRRHSLPVVYLLGLAMIAAIALLFLGTLVPAQIRRGFNRQMFWLGAAFLLLETRSLVTFALLFGSTWLVNSLVFFAILTSVMLAVLMTARLALRPSRWLFGALLGALVLGYALPTRALLDIGASPLRYAAASAVAFLPIFLANLVFAASFRLTGAAADVAFASNLLGAMVGGMLEYGALLIGYRHLLLLVIGFYVLAGARGLPRERSTA